MNQKRIAPTRWILFLLVAYTPLLQAQAVNARTFNEDGASSATSLLSSGTATRSDLQVTGTYPEDAGQGSAAAWLEGGAVKAITFSSDGATITKSAVAELSSGTASDLQLTGNDPEAAGFGAAAIWLEDGAVKAITFSSDGATITKSAVVTLSSGTATRSNLQLTGDFPEDVTNSGAAAVWLEGDSSSALQAQARRNAAASQLNLYVLLTWEAPSGFTPVQYLIYRDGVLIDTLAASVLSYRNNYLARKTQYSYSVVAQNSVGTTLTIDTATVTTP